MKKMLLGLLFVFTAQSIAIAGTDVPETLEGVKIVNATEVKDLMAKGVPLYDTRIANEYAEAHVKGAISLVYHEKSKKELAYDGSVDKFDDSKLPAEKMIFMCNGHDCWKSYKASKHALSKGKKEIYWFRGGFHDWKEAKLPIE